MGVDIGKIGSQFDSLINRLKAIQTYGPEELSRAVQRTGHLGLEIVAEEIHHVREHSGKHRVKPEPLVTDLIDTGHYLNTWVTTQTGPLSARISTNCEYALPLEFGKHGPELVKPYTFTTKKGKVVNVRAHVRNTNMTGFFIAHLSAVKIRAIFRPELQAALQRAVSRSA